MKNKYLHIDFKSAEIDASKCNNCTLDELAVLNAIAENPAITQIQLAEKIGKSERTIKTKTVEMQKKGFIQRINGKRNGHWEIMIDV